MQSNLGFFGRGAAGGLWRVAIAFAAIAAGFVLLGAVIAATDPQSWAPLAWFGFSLYAIIGCLAAWAGAALAAVAGRGALARPVLVLGAVVFAGAGLMAALSLEGTSAKGLVGGALAACAIGLAASLKAALAPRSA